MKEEHEGDVVSEAQAIRQMRGNLEPADYQKNGEYDHLVGHALSVNSVDYADTFTWNFLRLSCSFGDDAAFLFKGKYAKPSKPSKTQDELPAEPRHFAFTDATSASGITFELVEAAKRHRPRLGQPDAYALFIEDKDTSLVFPTTYFPFAPEPTLLLYMIEDKVGHIDLAETYSRNEVVTLRKLIGARNEARRIEPPTAILQWEYVAKANAEAAHHKAKRQESETPRDVPFSDTTLAKKPEDHEYTPEDFLEALKWPDDKAGTIRRALKEWGKGTKRGSRWALTEIEAKKFWIWYKPRRHEIPHPSRRKIARE